MSDDKKKEFTSTNLGLKYIAFEKYFMTEKGIVLTRAETEGKSQKVIKDLHEARLRKLDIYDYEYARSTGYLRKKKLDQVSPELKKESAPTIDVKVMSTKKFKFEFNPIVFITAATVLIGFAMLIVSISYTHAHIVKYTEPVIAWIFAIGLVSFNTISFESSLLFWKMSGGKPLSIFFGFLFVVVLAFTLSANADVIYARCRDNQNTNVKATSRTSAASSILTLTKEQTANKKQEVEDAKKALEDYSATEKPSNWRIAQLRNALDKKKAEYDTLINEQKANLNANPDVVVLTEQSSDTFYQFLAGRVGMNANDVETLLNMLSILFVDIVAPASFAVALFLGGRNYGRKEGRKEAGEEGR